MSKFRLSVGIATPLAFFCITASAQQTDYTLLDLGSVDAVAMNASGQIVGHIGPQMTRRAFYTDANGQGLHELTLPADTQYATVNDINDAGQIVGFYRSNSNPDSRALITDANGQNPHELAYPSAYVSGGIYAINNQGQMLASLADPTSAYSVVALGGSVGVLPSYHDYYSTGVQPAINDQGLVAGTMTVGFDSSAFSSINHVFVGTMDGSVLKDLGTLGGRNSFSTGMNNAGQVIGSANTVEGKTHAFVTGPDGAGMQDLGTFGGSYSMALAINNLGWVVGYAGVEGDKAWHPFLWRKGDQGLIDLSYLLPSVEAYLDMSAVDINDAGQILLHDLGGHSYLLTPSAVPELDGSWMMLLGLTTLGAAAAHRRRTSANQALG